MSIATAITAAQGRVADAYTAISNKGGTLPATQNLTNMPTAINSIQSADIVSTINNSSSAVSKGEKVWLSEGISGQSTSAINQHWAMSTSGNYVPTVASDNIYSSEVISPTSYNTSSTSAVEFDFSTSPSYIPNYIYGDSGCYSTQYTHVFVCDDNGVYGHTLNSANSEIYKTFVIGSNIVWCYNNSVSSYAFHRMNRNGITLLPNTTSANNTNDNYFYTNGYLYKEPTKNSFYDRYDGSYRTYNLETGELGSEVGFSINSLSDWWYPHMTAIFGVTSDGKYIIGANTNPGYQNSMKLQFGKINSLGNLTKVGTDPSVLADFYDNGGTARYLACSFNPNNDLLILTKFNTANYWMFKYNPSDESWSNVTVDLSGGFNFTGKYFQGPMCASNDMKNFSFIYSTSTGNPGRNVYQAYVRLGNYVIKDFYKTLKSNYKVNGQVCKFTDGAYGAFSENNYFTLEKNISTASTFEAVIKFTSPTSDISNFQNILDFDPFTELFIESGQLRVYSETAGTYVSCGSVSTGTVYWAKIVKENGTTKLSYSTDGKTFTGEVSINDTESTITNKKIGAGLYSPRVFKGAIFLEESYIKIDGTMYEYCSSDALTGFAQENIAIGSSGSVKTALPSEVTPIPPTTPENNNNQGSGGSESGLQVIGN